MRIARRVPRTTTTTTPASSSSSSSSSFSTLLLLVVNWFGELAAVSGAFQAGGGASGATKRMPRQQLLASSSGPPFLMMPRSQPARRSCCRRRPMMHPLLPTRSGTLCLRSTSSSSASPPSLSGNQPNGTIIDDAEANGLAPAGAATAAAVPLQGDQISHTSRGPLAMGDRMATDAKTVEDVSSLLAIDPAAVDIVCLEDEMPLAEVNGAQDDEGGGDGMESLTVSKGTEQQAAPSSLSSPRLASPSSSSDSSSSSSSSSSLSASFLRQLPFVSMFRGSANYIANHRGTTAVYHIPGGLVDSSLGGDSNNNNMFRDLMNDVALTWLLGMKIVLVVGCRHQIERRLGISRSVLDDDRLYGLRVTDEETLRVVKEEAGYVRFEVERQLARSLRVQGAGAANTASSSSSSSSQKAAGGGTNSGPGSSESSSTSSSQGAGGYYDGNVVSGNFYSAQPFGILDGVDYKYTGFVRRVEVEKIRKLHESRDICLLTTLGVSPSGEVFNVNSESLACSVAGALQASKVIFFTEKEMELRHASSGNKIQSLRLSDARNLIKYAGLTVHPKGYVTLDHDQQQRSFERSAMQVLLRIGYGMQALEQGVKRAHIISPKHGALLQELYTRDGSGILVSGDLYDGIRRAAVNDVAGIYELISPLIKMGTLIDRPKAALEKDIDTYYVYTRDNHIVACGQLKKFEDGFAEIGCLVVNKDYRSRGRGDAMLGYLERLCVVNGCATVFVLSTQTMEWFVERGFEEVDVERLPPSRQQTYNYARRSKIYLKKIESLRDLDASELWWNR